MIQLRRVSHSKNEISQVEKVKQHDLITSQSLHRRKTVFTEERLSKVPASRAIGMPRGSSDWMTQQVLIIPSYTFNQQNP